MDSKLYELAGPARDPSVKKVPGGHVETAEIDLVAVPCDPNARRLGVLRVSPEFLIRIAKAGSIAKVTARGLPADAEVVSTIYNRARNCLFVTVRSESFAEVAHGATIPSIPDPQFQDT